MSRGTIRRRGKASWELKFDLPGENGQRQTKYVTVRGRRADAERELNRLIATTHDGSFVEPSKTTIADYIDAWLDADRDLAPKTKERYRELAHQQIGPHLGTTPLQKLRPSQVADWHKTLLERGGRRGRPLSARTVGHCHRLLKRALQRAVAREEVTRNVVSAVSPPKIDEKEIEILDAEQIQTVLAALADHDLLTIITLALVTGLRRGELMGLQLGDIDLDAASLRVERSLEETKAGGLRFKAPKTKRGRRTISLPPSTVAMLRDHRRKLLEQRLALGLGRPEAETLLFANLDGSPRAPSNVTAVWRWAVTSHGLPKVSFHALRHTHASALIRAGVDVVTVSRRLGHANPTVTLNTYSHLFERVDTSAAAAIEAAITGAR